jgi:hypothetical protein
MTQPRPTGEATDREQWLDAHLRPAQLPLSFLIDRERPGAA